MKNCGFEIDDSVGDFRDKYLGFLNRTEPFRCYCDNEFKDAKSVTRRKYSKADAIHSLFWPFLFLFLMIVIIAIGCAKVHEWTRKSKYDIN